MYGSIGTDIGIIISACIQNHSIVEYLDCDFVRVRMVTFLPGMGVEWLERSILF